MNQIGAAHCGTYRPGGRRYAGVECRRGKSSGLSPPWLPHRPLAVAYTRRLYHTRRV
jgi:hypothetical protein